MRVLVPLAVVVTLLFAGAFVATAFGNLQSLGSALTGPEGILFSNYATVATILAGVAVLGGLVLITTWLFRSH